MSKPVASLKHTRVQKVCTLWTHDENFSKDDVVFNGEKFPELPATPGSLIRIIALKHATAIRDFQTSAKMASKDANQVKIEDASKDAIPDAHPRRARRQSVMLTLDENGTIIQGGREVDPEKSYIFVAKPMTPDVKSKYPNLQVSISEKIAKVFGFRNRIQIVVTSTDEETHSASYVEIAFRDEYLARADMWRMSISELSNRTVYRGQKLLFMGTIKATVKNVYINGQSAHSGYFSSMTKPVFRSESARYVLFIQMSKEMWDFDAEGAGEIMFNKVVNGFLPDLFKRWMKINARHLVTIILFTRMQYDGECSQDQSLSVDSAGRGDFDSQNCRFRDYYRVVVSDMASGDWINILYHLKKEFRAFLRDVSLVPKPPNNPASAEEKMSAKSEPELIIAGMPSTAAHGNVLEAINLAAAQFAKDYIDRDLIRTGISVVVITAGTGVFEVDYNILKLTTDTLIGSGVGIDLVCLSPMPLHSVPLFKYRNPRLVSSMKPKETDRSDECESFDGLEEQDDKTPRQYHLSLGSVARVSPTAPPPLIPTDTTITVPEESDEWRYAMPHWVDVSFWSGPSDEIIELSKPRKPSKNMAKARKKVGTFTLRCRMYELQMMGVMENELGDISIPYMEEDPLYPHGLREQFDNSKVKAQEHMEKIKISRGGKGSYASRDEKSESDGHLNNIKGLQKTWMDAYDENVFSPLILRRPVQDHLQNRLHKIEAPSNDETTSHQPKDLLSASLKSPGSSFGKTARPPPEATFHQLMRERSNDTESQFPRGNNHRNVETRYQGVPRADILYPQMSSTRTRDFHRSGFHQRGDSGDSNDHRRSIQTTPNDSPAVSRGNTPPKRTVPAAITPTISTPSIKADTSTRPAGWFLRQISFGGKAIAAPKATSANIEITTGQTKPAKLTVENNQKGAIAAKLASTRSVNSEKPSVPIAIRNPSRSSVASTNSPSSDLVPKSVETVRGNQPVRKSITSHPGSVTKESMSTILLAGQASKLDISSSGGAYEIPRTLSPTNAISPWAVLVNPCNPKKNNMNIANQFRRWQHVFPKRPRTSSVKWKSLCSPAAIPLTNEHFPTTEQLTAEYNESPYKITQNDDDDVEVPKSRESLIRELIAFRLSHGFQIIVGSAVAEFYGGREHDISKIFHSDYMSNDGDTVFMSVGNTIHQLVCVAGGEVEVKRFSRKPTTALQSSAGIDSPLPYKPFIRTALENKYQARDIVLRPLRKEYNWNFIDTFLAGYHDEFSEVLRFWRARFVLIPVELPTVNRRPLPLLTEDSEEEIRLEGIRKLTQVWQRYRYIPPDERERQHFQATTTKKQKDPNPLAIEYQTRDPSVIVAAGPDSALLTDGDNDFPTSLFSETPQYHTSSIDLKKLAEDLQGEKGIQMLDRRWHWRLHYNCFLGFDLTTWLLQNFKDIETRDEAVDLGNQLMNKGLFQHVQKKHQFRDGNFFYQIAAEFRAPRPESRTGWFGMRRPDRSVPSTPLSEGPRLSPLTARSGKSRSSTSDSSSVGDEKGGEKTPTRAGTPKRTVTLSRVMRYDVDPRKRSYRPEIINLHYDRLHNPDNCYHIRIDWMNVTAKLIEDAIVTWATSVEKYGLKLVEVPIAEASNITDHHPFRSPYTVKLALKPPERQPEQVWDTAHFSPQSKTDRFAYHKALLRKLNFVLDMEAASAFPSDVDVTYSWGQPDYKYSQFIHRSGVLLAQITNEGEFLLLANRLAHNRAKDAVKLRPTDPYDRRRNATSAERTVSTPAERANPHRSPFSSPLARPVQDSSLLHTALQEKTAPPMPVPQTPEQIKDEIEAFCSDPIALKAVYEEAFRQTPSPSPRITPVLDNNIPSLGLPPAISIREASPAGPGWILGSSLIGTPGAGMVAKRHGSDGSGSGTESARRQGSEGGSMERNAKRQNSEGSAGAGV
ncbi:hypothetical protein K469DRAFT_640248 [Zopfia rhizophila CBS 207.26]|uniref:Vacuolar membrane-associated protein IML1 n=1 Tax=Zopfia rhizophila CBS 207.26 TaxID=1314779 RepID=A0A6A6DKN4_9PEZI|nr:hypothetical protein K469DRAFT_640248 [Zopfia rhizophila CBS 207.26]